MAKKKNNQQMYWILGVVAIIVFIVGGNAGWFKSELNVAGDTINKLEQPQTTKDICTLTIIPSSISAGDLFTGKIKANPRVFCEVFGKPTDGEWGKVYEGITDINGNLQDSENIFIEGNFIFKAICGDCITNQATLNVNPVASSDCTDTDGINKMTPGWVVYDGLSYYDFCVSNVVTEYYCDLGVQTRVLPCDLGYSCVFTRSGDYCSLDDGLAPGTIIGMESGNYYNMPGGSGNYYEIDLETEPGNNPICAEIEVEASLSAVACVPGMPIVKFDFYDSTGVVWTKSQAVDFSTYGNPAVIHVSWNGQTPFKMITTNLGFCNVNARSTVKLKVCD